MTMTIDETRADAAGTDDGIPARVGDTGGPARMAALLLLAKYPDGVLLHDLWLAMRAADPRVRDATVASNVMQSLRRSNLAATERGPDLQRVWFSPTARYADQVRRRAGWRPPTTAPRS